MSDSADARRRWCGLFFLVVAAGLLVWGETWLKSQLKGLAFLVYWLICFGMTGLAIVTAILDLRAIRRRTQEEQRDLLDRTWRDIQNKPDDWDRIR